VLVDGDGTAPTVVQYGTVTFHSDRSWLMERADEPALTNQSSTSRADRSHDRSTTVLFVRFLFFPVVYAVYSACLVYR